MGSPNVRNILFIIQIDELSQYYTKETAFFHRMQGTLAKLCKPNPSISITTLSRKNAIDSPLPSLCYNLILDPHQIDNAITRCVDTGDLRFGWSIHSYILKINPFGFITPWNKLLSLYIKCGQFRSACNLFDEMPKRDVVSFNTMISAYTRHSYFRQALSLYKKLKADDLNPNHITLSGLIRACDGLTEKCLMDIFHAQGIRYGLNSNEYVGSSLVNGYANQMKLFDAAKAFTEISHLDLISWNIMIDSCVRNNNKELTLRIFTRMLHEDIEFDEFTLTSVIKMFLGSMEVDNGKMLHCCAVKNGLAQETSVANSLISMYSKCETGMTSARRVFEETMDANIISWTAIISGLMQNGLNKEAVRYYLNMLRIGMKENNFSFASILPVCGNLVNVEHGSQIHARIVKSFYRFDLTVNNALIDMYSRCGCLDEACFVYKEMGKHDRVSCTSMITAFAHHGKGREAVEILDEITREGLNPDDITFLSCICACSHGGQVDEGIYALRTMIDVYKIKPRKEHLSSVVDMLGRAGRLAEAEMFIDEMGLDLNVHVWEALLSACRFHGQTQLGEKCAKKIIELNPDRQGSYVSLSHIFAERGLWEDKRLVLENLYATSLEKELGCSWMAS